MKSIDVGTRVKFRDESGQLVRGTVRRMSRSTAVVEALGVEWNLDMSLLLVADKPVKETL